MKFKIKIEILVVFMVALLSLVFLKGCGTLDSETGCPATLTFYSSCVNWGVTGDTISGPADDSVTAAYPFGGGSFRYSPLQYTVRDINGDPLNDVCVTFVSDGFFYSDANYTQNAPNLTPGSGMYTVTLKTNNRGIVCLYWDTEDLPPSQTGTGAASQSGQSWINASSGGAASDEFQVSWTVEAGGQ